MTEKQNAWLRQRDADGKLEPARWYSRFDIYYRPPGPERSLLAAYRAWRVQKGAKGRNVNSLAKSWERNAKTWRWQERAEAWDAHEADKRHLEEAEEAAKARKQRIGAFQTLLGKGYERVKKGLDGETAAVRAIIAGAQGLRLEFGEPTEHIRLSDHGHLVEDYTELSDEELRKAISRRSRAGGEEQDTGE